MANDDDTPVYLFDVHGHFAWNHSCPPGSSPSACTSVGTDAVFTLDESRLIVLDIGVVKGGLHLAALGTVGHVAL